MVADPPVSALASGDRPACLRYFDAIRSRVGALLEVAEEGPSGSTAHHQCRGDRGVAQRHLGGPAAVQLQRVGPVGG